MVTALPGATPAISYGLPTLQVDGISLIAINGFTRHNSLFPYSSGALKSLSKELSGYEQTKGSIHFPLDSPFPAPLLKRLLRVRLDEVNASFPNRAGHVRAFYDNGFLKYTGKMKEAQQHGDWSWFRRDGSLMRTGSFRNGRQVGQWTTYDRNGNPVKVTKLTG